MKQPDSRQQPLFSCIGLPLTKSILSFFTRGAWARRQCIREEPEDDRGRGDVRPIAAMVFPSVPPEGERRMQDPPLPQPERVAEIQAAAHTDEWATATTFPKLFRLLDATQALWGSQKQYTAAELKKRINRVCTRNRAFHLPLQVIPTTEGLRQQVSALLCVESALARIKTNSDRRTNRQCDEKGEVWTSK